MKLYVDHALITIKKQLNFLRLVKKIVSVAKVLFLSETNAKVRKLIDSFTKSNQIKLSLIILVITCPHVTPPTNGYFVKKSCSNVLHAACGVRCNIGFDLTGSSVRLCQKNGTWSGVAPRCVAKNCDKLKPVSNAEIICTNEDEDFEVVIKYDENGNKTKQLIKRLQANEEDSRKLIKAPIFDPLITPDVELNFTIDTECKFSCLEGFSLVGSKARSCLPVMRWGGLQTTCKGKIKTILFRLLATILLFSFSYNLFILARA